MPLCHASLPVATRAADEYGHVGARRYVFRSLDRCAALLARQRAVLRGSHSAASLPGRVCRSNVGVRVEGVEPSDPLDACRVDKSSWTHETSGSVQVLGAMKRAIVSIKKRSFIQRESSCMVSSSANTKREPCQESPKRAVSTRAYGTFARQSGTGYGRAIQSSATPCRARRACWKVQRDPDREPSRVRQERAVRSLGKALRHSG